jgi:osmotically-inducible protein OsmY
MKVPALLLATGAALALAACQTTPDDDAGASPASSSSTASSGTWSKPDDTLHDRVHDALMEQMGPAVNDVGVKVDGSKVILTGSVKTEADKKRAHDIAHGVRGATVVDDSGLVVKP